MKENRERTRTILMLLLLLGGIGFLMRDKPFTGRKQLSDDWRLLLVNHDNPIPKGYQTELCRFSDGVYVDERICNDLQAMMDAAHDAGLSPVICSSYRTTEKQQALYEREVQQYLDKGYSRKKAKAEAAKWVAVPGTSEHQTGLALDIVDLNYQILDKAQEQTPVQKWLMEHSCQYGFILRYPNEKSDITGICYEPWHYRYVGKDAALAIFTQQITLEEFLSDSK